DHIFLTYFAVRCPVGIPAPAIAKRLQSLPNVELTYVEGNYSCPAGTSLATTMEDIDNKQKYLGPAPDGIDAQAAWNILGGDGGGAEADLGFVDIEQGWLIAADYQNPHVDLPSNIGRIWGVN